MGGRSHLRVTAVVFACLAGCGTLRVDYGSGSGGGNNGDTGETGDTGDTGDSGDTGVLPDPSDPWEIVGSAAEQRVGAGGTAVADDFGGGRGGGVVVTAPADSAVALHVAPEGGGTVDFDAGFALLLGEDASDFGCSVAWEAGEGGGSVVVGACTERAQDGEQGTGALWALPAAALSGTVDAADHASTHVHGEVGGGGFGSAVASGDVDGDGLPDLIVGAPGEHYDAGRVYLFTADERQSVTSAKDTSWFVHGLNTDDALGTAVETADLDGDGYDEIVAGAPGYDGWVGEIGACVVMSGGSGLSAVDGSVWDVVSAAFSGSEYGDVMGDGAGTIGLGDLDGDGNVDLALGVPGHDGEVQDGGAVAVYWGGSLSGALTTEEAGALYEGLGLAGTAVALTRDVDGDGALDLLIGGPSSSDGAGAVYHLTSAPKTSGSILDLAGGTWIGESSEALGSAVGGFTDADGPGTWEAVVAAPLYEGSHLEAGRVRVIP